MTNDPINPNHYKTQSGIECIDVAEHLGYCLGNALKYAWRAGQKDNIVQDLSKCEWYIKRAYLTGEDADTVDERKGVTAIRKLEYYLDHETTHAYQHRKDLLRAIAAKRIKDAWRIASESIALLQKR